MFKKTNVTQLLEFLLYTFPKYKIEPSFISVMDHLSNEDLHERWMPVTIHALTKKTKIIIGHLRTKILKQKPKLQLLTITQKQYLFT